MVVICCGLKARATLARGNAPGANRLPLSGLKARATLAWGNAPGANRLTLSGLKARAKCLTVAVAFLVVIPRNLPLPLPLFLRLLLPFGLSSRMDLRLLFPLFLLSPVPFWLSFPKGICFLPLDLHAAA